MKATISTLAALLVSICALNTAAAQSPYPYPYPYPVVPVGYGAPAAGYGAPAAGYGAPAAGYAAPGGCTNCNGGQSGLMAGLGLKQSGCQGGGCNGGCGACGHLGGLCAALKGWLCRPFPSNAPSHQGNLGFPQHPYLRSPRDYFMYDMPY